MGPKAKGKKKSKKKSDGDGEKKRQDELSFNEMVLFCRIQAAQDQIKRVQSEVEKVHRRNARQKERNKLLKEEQATHIDNAVRQAKELESELSNQDVISKEEVESAFKNHLLEEQSQKNEVMEIEGRITEVKEELEAVMAKVNALKDYKAHGQYAHATQIKVMKQEMEDLDTSFAEMTEQVATNLEVAKESAEKMVVTSIAEQKEVASERAMDELNQESQQEFMDNKWLLKEVQIHQQQLEKYNQLVDNLEAENLDIISRLFEHRLSGNTISRLPLASMETTNEKEEEEDEEEGEADNNNDSNANSDVIQWKPKYTVDGDLENYLSDLQEDLEGGANGIGEHHLLHVRGHAITPVRVLNEDLTQHPTSDTEWSLTNLPLSQISS